MIKGYIFDYGGTLDTEGHHWGKVLWHAYERQQLPITEAQFREAYVHGERTLGSTALIRPDFTFRQTLSVKLQLELDFLREKAYWSVDEAALQQVHAQLLNDVYAGVLRTTAHSRDVLTQLHAHYPMVLVSNFYGNVNTVLREFQLDHLFNDVVESAMVGIRKPDPRIYKMGVDCLNLSPSDVVVVGDSFYKDIEPAKKIGCQAVWFKGESWTNEQYDETFPDQVITDLAQLL